jgi:hypothetical protein
MNLPAPQSKELQQRNRRSAARIVSAVLLFHSLALYGGYRVLDSALHPDPSAAAPAERNRLSKAPPSVTPSPPLKATQPDWPAWVAAAQSHDTAAPWRVDAQGRVVLEAGR